MEFSGFDRDSGDRPLTDEERALQLKQKQRLDIEPHDNLCVIKLNSTYLESVDKWFAWRGLITGVMLVMMACAVGFYGAMVHVVWTRGPHVGPAADDVLVLSSVALIICLFLAGLTWGLRKESFAYTHYPMRFNRKTRMVHVFRPGGTVLSVPWDALFFTLGYLPKWGEWEVRCHLMAPDKNTVRATFALSYRGTSNVSSAFTRYGHASEHDFVRAHWEFVRRYMEDGPQAVASRLEFCMPVDTRRESFQVGMARVFANISGAPLPLYWLVAPLCLFVGLFRPFAMRTSRIPQWPAEIEAASTIEPADPYAIEGDGAGRLRSIVPQS